MCLSPEAYVRARMYDKLTRAGVSPEKASAVAAKIARRYGERRAEARRLRST